jgi:hypothetical protein
VLKWLNFVLCLKALLKMVSVRVQETGCSRYKADKISKRGLVQDYDFGPNPTEHSVERSDCAIEILEKIRSY